MARKAVLKRPSASKPIKEKKNDEPDSNANFEKRCSEYFFSDLEVDNFFAYCNYCGRLKSIRALALTVIENDIEKICIRCYR